MTNMYKVVGSVAKFGPGQVLTLNADQIRARRVALDLPDGYDPNAKGAEPAKVKASAATEFKVGEVIGLDESPSAIGRHLLDRLELQNPPKTDGEPAPAPVLAAKAHADDERTRRNKAKRR